MMLLIVSNQMDFAIIHPNGRVITTGICDDGHEGVALAAAAGTLQAHGVSTQTADISVQHDAEGEVAQAVARMLAVNARHAVDAGDLARVLGVMSGPPHRVETFRGVPTHSWDVPGEYHASRRAPGA